VKGTVAERAQGTKRYEEGSKYTQPKGERGSVSKLENIEEVKKKMKGLSKREKKKRETG